MPTTTPHGITVPEPNDPFDPAADMNRIADGIETALDALDDAGLPGTTWTVIPAKITSDPENVTLGEDATAKQRTHGPIEQFVFSATIDADVPSGTRLTVVTPTPPVYGLGGFLIATADHTTTTGQVTHLPVLPTATGLTINSPGITAGDRMHLSAEYEAS